MGTCTSTTPTEYYPKSSMIQLPTNADLNQIPTQSTNSPTASSRNDTIIPLQPPRQSLHDVQSNSSSTLSSTSSDTYTQSNSPSKLLYSMNTNNLACLVRYILENEPLFDKYKHKSDTIYNAFVNYRIKGKTLRKLSRVEFAEELPWIRSVISTKLYIWLKSLSDDEIVQMLTTIKHTEFVLEQISEQMSLQITQTSTYSYQLMDEVTTDIHIQLPEYLKQHHENISYNSPVGEFSQEIVDQLVALGYGTEQECISASRLTNNYCDINQVADKLLGRTSMLSRNISEMDFQMFDEKSFQIFVYTLCVTNNYNDATIETLLKALMDIGMNGSEFFSLKNIQFCKMLRKYQIKAGIASKLYKLIMNKHENISFPEQTNKKQLTCNEIVDISVNEFQICAYHMLESMNENMKINMVNGLILFEHYKSKECLKMYLKENVTCKSVDVLADLMWGDYLRDKDKIDQRVIRYSRKQLLKYFIALYHYHVTEVIIKYNLNKNKCFALKRKGICKIFIDECAFSFGVVTNIVDKIYSKIDE